MRDRAVGFKEIGGKGNSISSIFTNCDFLEIGKYENFC